MSTTSPLTLVASRVGGEALRTSEVYEVDNPFSEQVIGHVADDGSDAVEMAVAAAHDAQPLWAALPLARRREALAVTADHLASRRQLLVDLAVSDSGAATWFAESVHVDAAIARLRQWAARDERALTVPSPASDGGLGGVVSRVPVGVVACISPYNVPLLAMMGKVAPALFAGNSIVMKPAPQDPLIINELCLALEAGVRAVGGPAGTVNMVTGAGAAPGAALVDHPDVAAVSFTGSTAVGTEIYRSAAQSMKRLLLELGGKGAMIVRADADLDAVVGDATRTWRVQGGQICVTTARVLVDASVHDALVDRLLERLSSLRHGDPRDPDTDVIPLISAAQRDRVASLVDTSRTEGATVHQGGPVPAQGWFHPATLVTGCTPEQTAMQEEAFGPLLCVMPTSSDDEAIAVANSTRFGLSNYLYTRDAAAARDLAPRLRSAQVGVNTVRRHPDLPFGGVGGSGLGRSGGAYALDVYTDLQAVGTQDGTFV